MNLTHTHDKTASWTGEKKYRLANFFNQYWDIYKQSPTEPITSEQYKAVNAMRVCRTEALGVDYYSCPECGETTKVYHSCKNRFCPTCSWNDTLKWADKLKDNMMDIPHRHVVMTLPHQLNSLIKKHKKELLSALMRTAADTFKDWMLHKYDIVPGIISVLHTFGEVKQYHVHVHMIVSWGGIHNETSLLQTIESEYVSYDFLKKKFRCKFEDELFALFNDGTFEDDFYDESEFKKFIKYINKQKWIIHLEPPMKIPTQVIKYIGRYSKRACLSEYKITKIEGEYITFKYKDNKIKDINNKPVERELELNYKEFFPRLLQHVPLKYFRLVRYYGSYSNRANIPEEYLYKGTETETETKEQEIQSDESWEELQISKTGTNPLICSNCEKRKIYLYTRIKIRNENKTITLKRIDLIKKEFRKEGAA